MRNIKKEYKKYVVSYFLLYLIFNAIIIIIKYNLIAVEAINVIKENNFIIKPIYTVSCIPLLSIIGLVILNLIPSNIKEILIFWKTKNRLPSYRWKNKIAIKDSRINIKILNKYYKLSNSKYNYKEWNYSKHKFGADT